MRIIIKESQYKILFEQTNSNILNAYNEIVSASSGIGTNPDKILKSLDKINNIQDFKILLYMFKDKKTGYGSFEEMINKEYERDNYDDVLKIKQKLYPLGVLVSFKVGKNRLGNQLFMGDFRFKRFDVSGTNQNDISNKNCVNKYNPLLIKAKKYWVDWLSNKITKQKFIKNWSDKGYDINDVNRIFKNYMGSLNKLKLFFYNDSIDKINGVNVSGLRDAFAFVNEGSPNNIYVNCSLNDEDALGTLVHEIQHILYYIHPLNPDDKVGELFVTKDTKKMGPLDFLSKIFKTDNNKTDTNLSQKINNISKKHNVSFDVLKNLYLNSHNYEKKKPGYACSMNEKMSNIMSIRKLLNIKPGQNITLEMLNPYIEGKKLHTDVSWLLYCWALNEFPNINTLINNMNQLAHQDFKKQDNTRLA